MRFRVLAATVLVLASAAATKGEGPEITLEVAGVRVSGQGYKEDMNIRPFGSFFVGSSVAVLVRCQGASLIGIDADACKLSQVADDKGTDLAGATDEMLGRPAGFWTPGQVSKDGKAGMLQLDAWKVPAKGARSIHIEGALACHTASGREEKKVEASFEKDAKLAIGPVALTIEKADKPDFSMDDFPFEISFRSEKPLHEIADMKALGEDGKEMKCEYSVNPFVLPDMATGKPCYRGSLRMAKAEKKGTIVFVLHTGIKTVTVPMKLDASVGL
ncbi:hypothetical protein HY251_19635 [bacterium]|nr:hypothetical protein [bacterium]